MEGGRDDGGRGVAGAPSAGQDQRRWWRGAGAGCGDEEEESSHGSSGGGGGGVELSLRLRTGAADDDDDGAATAPPTTTTLPLPPAVLEARRNMTIFYNGRVCAADVTEIQARAIISMASEETLLVADHRRRQRQQLMRGDDCHGRRLQDGGGDCSSSSSSAAVARRCARDRGHAVRPPAAAALALAAGVVGSPRQIGFAPVLEIDPAAAASGLSMKRSLQQYGRRCCAALRRRRPPGSRCQAMRQYCSNLTGRPALMT